MAAARKSQGTSLSVSDWLEAGYAVIAEEGVRALKIERLCRQVGATRGSFYWHFEDIGSYREALVTSWNSFLEQDRASLADLDGLPPRERLSKMMDLLVSPQYWTLERAMREWARSDPTAAANVRAADRRVVRRVTKIFSDHGCSEDEARFRAMATFAAGIGMLHLAGSAAQTGSSAQRERFLDLMLADPK